MSTPKVRVGTQCARECSAPSLEDLMLAYLGGSSTAFSTLHSRLQPLVRRQIAARIRGDADVDDLTQQTFLRFHSARTHYRPPPGGGDRAVIAWICTIARNTAISHLRRSRGDRLRFDAGAQRSVDEAASSYVAPAALFARDEAMARRRREIRDAVARLPDSQRSVVERSKFDGVPMKAIARQMGLRDVAVRVRAHRAYKTLRLTLGELRRSIDVGLTPA